MRERLRGATPARREPVTGVSQAPWIIAGSRRNNIPAHDQADLDPFARLAVAWVERSVPPWWWSWACDSGRAPGRCSTGCAAVDGHVWASTPWNGTTSRIRSSRTCSRTRWRWSIAGSGSTCSTWRSTRIARTMRGDGGRVRRALPGHRRPRHASSPVSPRRGRRRAGRRGPVAGVRVPRRLHGLDGARPARRAVSDRGRRVERRGDTGPGPVRGLTGATIPRLGVRMDSAADLYLDLMMRCLDRLALRRVRRAGPRRGTGLAGAAHTMIGLKRLANVRDCVDERPGRRRAGRPDRDRRLAGRNDDLHAGDPQGPWRHRPHGLGRRLVRRAAAAGRRPLSARRRDRLHQFPQLAVSLDQVRDNFRRYGLLDDQVRFLQGWFRDTLPSAPIERLAVLRLDGDLYESTIQALEGLYDRLSVGGYVIVDDYGNVAGCRQAVHDFRDEAGSRTRSGRSTGPASTGGAGGSRAS